MRFLCAFYALSMRFLCAFHALSILSTSFLFQMDIVAIRPCQNGRTFNFDYCHTLLTLIYQPPSAK